MAVTNPTAADLYNAAWQAKIDTSSALQAWVAAGHSKSGPAYDAWLAANAAEAKANAAVAAGPTAAQTVPTEINVGPPERLTDQGIPAGYELGDAYNADGGLKPGWELDPATNVYKFTGRTEAPIPQKEAPADTFTTATATTTKSSDLSPPVVSEIESRPAVTPVTVETAKPEQAVAPEEDPFEAARLAAAADNTPSPTEQVVINASEDPALSASQQAALEEQQAANRATLQQEDATDRAAQVLVKPGAALDSPITAVPDWRVKLKLAKHGADYLYNSAMPGDILYPLKQTGGVVFPYTPTIQTSYKANYDPTDLTHSNYRLFFYKSSHVDDITITCDFTAQDSNEASYMLAVIHFFKSVTKMFYGQDKAPSAGTPPPLVFLSGYGQYQFNDHPLLVSSFTYNLPNEVDYIRASTGSNVTLSGNGGAGAPNASYVPGLDFIKSRLLGASLNKGGATSQPTFTLRASGEPTYVPTKIQLQIQCLPVVTRNDISNNFSLKDYAAGNLTKRSSGGIW